MNPVSKWLEKRRVERELADEIAEHLAETIDQLREEGHGEDEARTLARRQFGNTTLQQEDSRAAWGWNSVEQLWQDLHFGGRRFRYLDSSPECLTKRDPIRSFARMIKTGRIPPPLSEGS